MKDLLNKSSDLSRTSLQDLKKILSIIKLESLVTAIDNPDEEGNIEVEIPYFGKVVVSEDFDFEFIPETSFKKDVFGIRQDPDKFLTNELKKLLKLGENNG